MDATEFAGLRLSRARSTPRFWGDIVIVETTNGKLCMGFYCDSDASRNLYLVCVTIFSKDSKYRHWLRRCWMKSQMIRNIFVVETTEDAGKARDGARAREQRRHGNAHASVEAWDNRAPRKRLQDNGDHCRENVVTLSRPECIVEDPRVTCGRNGYRYALIEKMRTSAECEFVDDYAEHAPSVDRRPNYTGIYVWRHIKPTGKSWDVTTVDQAQDADVTKAAMDVHWGGGIVARHRACHTSRSPRVERRDGHDDDRP